MSKFFINRPIVAMVISILMTIVGLVAMSGLPTAQFPNIVPPQIQVSSTYTGADALTVEQAVATPIEQQMSGVDNMDYMYSINANNGQSTLYVNFALGTDANTDQLLAQMREGQAESQLPSDVRNYGVTVQKSTSSPLIMFALYSPNGTYDNVFLANYAYININDQMTRVKGIASVTVFGAGQYAMRLWVKPDQLAKLNITVPEIINAVQNQNTVNPAGTIGGEPVPAGQSFTYAVRAQGRLQSTEEFGNIVLRANPDGSVVRVADVARIELGAQTYSQQGRLNGKPAALVALYQMPGANALDAADGAKKLMEKIKESFPPDLEYVIALDTTLSVTEGIKEIEHTLIEALVLVMIVVFVFLQGWRATLIPLLAVPVSLVGTFMLFPMFGFSINTLSLFGLVLAIGLVVDDAIVVVEAVEHHIEHGLSPKDATLRAMSEVTGPVIAIAVILAAVFVPTAFIPGITGQLYQQFAVTIAISVIISAFNALTLSPALCALLLRPKVRGSGPLQKFYDGFNRAFGRVTGGYVGVCRLAIRRSVMSLFFLVAVAVVAGFFGKLVPAGFLPDEDQGYVFAAIQLPNASSLQRTSDIAAQAEDLIMKVPGVQYTTTVIGYSMLSQVTNTYSAFFFITLKNWGERKAPDEQYTAIKAELTKRLASIPGAIAFAFPPPAIQGVGTSGGATFILEDRAGKDIAFLAANTTKFIEAAKKRPELASVSTTFLPIVPQLFIEVDQDKVLKQGVIISDVYKTLQSFLGSGFINYFNRFGRQWQVYVQAEGEYRTNIENVGRFYVRNNKGEAVPALGADLDPQHLGSGIHDALQPLPQRTDQRFGSAWLQFGAGDAGARSSFRRDDAKRNGLRLLGHVVPGAKGSAGRLADGHLWFLAALRLPDPGGAVRKLVAAFLGPARYADRRRRRLRRAAVARPGTQRLCADRPGDADRSGGQERDPHRRVRQDGIREGRTVARRIDAQRRGTAPAADPDDFVRLHSRLRSAGDRQRRRRHLAAGDGQRGDRRHAGRYLHCHLHHSGDFLRGRKDQSQGQYWGRSPRWGERRRGHREFHGTDCWKGGR
jgi:HAE1 family hydrophobic/amphiphilic exporter-1